MTYNPNDRVRSRITRNLGTVISHTHDPEVVRVKFDGATDPVCFDVADLELDWESSHCAMQERISFLENEVHEWEESDAAASVLGPIFTEEIEKLTKRAERLEKQLGEARRALTQIAKGQGMGPEWLKPAEVPGAMQSIANAALAALSATPWSKEKLLELAAKEDGCDVRVGGLAVDLGLYKAADNPPAAQQEKP